MFSGIALVACATDVDSPSLATAASALESPGLPCAVSTSTTSPATTVVAISRSARVGERWGHLPSSWARYTVSGRQCNVLASTPRPDGTFLQDLECNDALEAEMRLGGRAHRDVLVPLVWNDAVFDPREEYQFRYEPEEAYGYLTLITTITRLADFERAEGLGLEYNGERYYASKAFLASGGTLSSMQTLLDGTPAITHRFYAYGLRIPKEVQPIVTDTFRPFLVDIVDGTCRLEFDAHTKDADGTYHWQSNYTNWGRWTELVRE